MAWVPVIEMGTSETHTTTDASTLTELDTADGCTAAPKARDHWRRREPHPAWFGFRDRCTFCFDSDAEVLDEPLVLYSTNGKVHKVAKKHKPLPDSVLNEGE